MTVRYQLVAAAAVAAAGLASAQPVQVQIQRGRLVEPAYPADPAPPGTTPPAEPKLPANADPDPKSLAVPEAAVRRAKELVGKLGSARFSEREQATRELAKMGRLALPALQEALAAAALEPEAAVRAEGLMPKAEAEDMRARVACFLADAGGKYQHTLPGWEKFKGVAGTDAASRKLFAEILKAPSTHQMLLAAEKSSEEAGAVLNQYVSGLFAQQNGFARGGGFGNDLGGRAAQPAKQADVAAALFLEGQFTDTEITIQPSVPWGWGGVGVQSVTTYMFNVPEVSNAIYGNGEYAGPIRKILVQWMDTRETAQWAYQAYSYATNNIYQSDRKKAVKYALRALEAKGGQNNAYNKLNILQTYANQPNARELLPGVVKCLDDATLFWSWQNGNPGFDIQFRDYALACALQLTDQKPEDFGMSRTSGYGTGKQFNQQAFYFKDDTPPQNNPGGGGVVRPRPVRPVDPPKKEEPKKEEPKKEEPNKEEGKKLSQEDRRKAALKKWNEWVKANVGVDEADKDADARKKWEAWAATPPKKDEPKKDEPGKPEEPKKDEPKKAVEVAPAVEIAPAVLPRKK